ncbi:MAG: hypothetical protein ACI9ZT_002206, partial [Gammaproteobacteria bacterium]
FAFSMKRSFELIVFEGQLSSESGHKKIFSR